MSGRRRHKGGHEEEEHENEERWLVSFADMMTLLFCLFMVLFAISSVNTSKAAINDQFKTGQRSHTQDTRLFYRARGTRGKVIL